MSVDVLIPLMNRLASGAGGRISAQGLRGSSRAYLLSNVVRNLAKPLLVLTPGMAEARDFAEELRFFLGAAQDASGLPWDRRVVLFPPWDSLPFENLPPHPEISARRMAALFRALHGGPFVFVAPFEATMRFLTPPKILDAGAVTVSVGENSGRDELLEKLIRAGYRRAAQVEERGEVSIRGGIMDLYPPHYRKPLRIEFFGDEIESLRLFDPENQRSTEKMAEAVLIPAREVVAGEPQAARALESLRRRCHALGFNLSQTAEALEPLRTSPYAQVRECYLSHFYEKPGTIWDYFPKSVPVVLDTVSDFGEELESFYRDNARGHRAAVEAGRLVSAMEDLYLPSEAWLAALDSHPVLELDELARDGIGDRSYPYFTTTNDDLASVLKRSRGSQHLLQPLVDLIEKERGEGRQLFIVCKGRGSAQKLIDLLYEYNIHLGVVEGFTQPDPGDVGRVAIFLGDLERGFRFPAQGLTLVTDSEIFGKKGRRPNPARKGFGSTLAELSAGDLVVHADFGIGRFIGLTRIKVEGDEGDYLQLEYEGGDRLYLPVTRLNLVCRYTSMGDGAPRLDKLGGKAWEKARRTASEGVERVAHELLELYARRQLASRPPYSEPDLSYREFEATFPYEETRDQLSAIEEVMNDLARDRPMDRLICGDVGYGKTEVAIRAAFLAAQGGRQVALLAPTTVLAAQHYQSFIKRFEGYPINVEMLSRFVDKANQKEAMARLASGGADIVVGTHALLGSSLKFKNLGLIVIDEEHRFGVAQKEKLKKFRNNVDVLTLSATPIPRTLQMGLTGVRDLSIIETPPEDRIAVRTRVARFDDEVIREAVARELTRGGQVFFVHNRVQTIIEMADHLKEILPGIKLGVGHGQMREEELKKVMESFATGGLDLLLCTAIIESGLDIPRANTILIDRADTFGLADLYQLRGRVGRSSLQAYCHLLVPEERDMTQDARKRISALQQFSELGAGFKVAIHDLEIRGAGEFLGKNQSGHIAAIGFDLYAELLDEAVHKLKGEPFAKAPEPEIRLRVPAHFPEDYVSDPHIRLELYERLTRKENADEIEDFGYELVDRFGALPRPVLNLMEVMKLRLRLMAMRIPGLDFAAEKLVLTLGEDSSVDLDMVIRFALSHPDRCRLTPENRLRWSVGKVDDVSVLKAAGELLSHLGIV